MRATILLAVLAICGCSAKSALTIADVQEQHEALNGKVVRVQGWIAGCQPLGCPLQETPDGLGKWLSLGGSQEFDQALLNIGGPVYIGNPDGTGSGDLRRAPVFVEIQGKVDRTCFDHDGEVQPKIVKICLDRANEIDAPRLFKVIKSGPAPE